MGCNCGGKTAKQKYLYTAPNGVQTTYNTEIEARAAQIRNNGGSITPVPA
jgi:predicted enzyme related to lactoylglutathione lyase